MATKPSSTMRFRRSSKLAHNSVTTEVGRLIKGEAQAFKQRWEAVNAAEREELRSTTVAENSAR
jgi:hypothetical protein